MNKLTFKEENKERLDKYLVKKLEKFSRSKIQKLIKDEKITVNGQVVSAHFSLKNNDEIAIKGNLESDEMVAMTLPAKPKIIADEVDYLVISKPTGLVVHPTEGLKIKTLTDWLVEEYPEIKSVGDDERRPGIVHRLDKDVSGLMVIAKTQAMFESLKDQFKNHKIKKEYLGLAQGKFINNEGIIDFPIKRSTVTGKMVAGAKGEEGKESITQFEVLKKFINYTYLKLNLKTGRSHQIRTHLQAYGHPLVGDQLYKNKKINEKIELDRIFLHSHKLEFDDMDSNRQKFESGLPENLNKILTGLK